MVITTVKVTKSTAEAKTTIATTPRILKEINRKNRNRNTKGCSNNRNNKNRKSNHRKSSYSNTSETTG